MKMQLLALALAYAWGISIAPAQTQEQQQSHPMEHAAPPEVETAKPTPPLTLMQQRLEEMQSHWQRMSQATDPAERQKLMQEHQEKMRELGAMLRQAQANGSGAAGGKSGPGGGMMGRGGGMGCPGMAGGMMGRGDPMRSMMAHHEAMMAVLRQLEKRVDLLQTTVEQLLTDEAQ